MSKFTLLWAAVSLALALGMTSRAQPSSKGRAHVLAFQEPDPDSDAVEESADDYDVFYDRLSSDGNWFYDDEYGYIWQPNVAVSTSSWRPYADGHWVWTDRGWCWVSNENFGWATYHYGRWVRVSGTGWCWVPGDEWAPAWVSWRHTDDDDYVGWAPLPPEATVSVNVGVRSWCDNYYDIGPAAFAFIKIGDFCRPSYREYIAPPQQNITIINRTQNVTNIAYNNNVIYNYGPQYERVSQIVQRQGQQVPNYKINYLAQAQRAASFGTQAQGNQLRVVAPPPKLKPVAAVQPQAAKQLGKAQIERGWQNLPQNQAQQIRNKFTQEAPPPKTLPQKPLPPPKPEIRTAKAQQGQPGKPGATPPAPAGQPPAPGEKPANKTAAEQQKNEALRPQNQVKQEQLQQPGKPQEQPGKPPEPPKNIGQGNESQKAAAEKALEQQKKGEKPGPPKPAEPVEKAREAQKTTAEKELEQRKAQNPPEPPKTGDQVGKAREAEKGASEKGRRAEKGQPAQRPEPQRERAEPPNKEQPNPGQTQQRTAHPSKQTARHVETAPHVEQTSHPAQPHIVQQPRPQQAHPAAPHPQPQRVAQAPHPQTPRPQPQQHVAQAPHPQASHPPPPHAPQASRPPARPQPQKAVSKDKNKDHQG
jgi:hypothetical protein